MIETFSRFLSFINDRECSWRYDPALRRSMREQLARFSPEVSEQEIVHYWHQHWFDRTHALAEGHLHAYLQKSCYWAARRFVSTYVTGNYSLADCFQIAATQSTRVLRGFNPAHGSSLERYAAPVFNSIIRETLRQQREAHICTSSALLREVSKKRFIEALHHKGLTDRETKRSLLAWECFRRVYVPTYAGTSKKLQWPGPEVWQAILVEYNREAVGLGLPGQTQSEDLENLLRDCVAAVRNYIFPTRVSYNEPAPGHESDLLTSLRAEGADSLIDALADQEEEANRRVELTALNGLLKQTLAALEPQMREVVDLYYSQACTQQQIAEKFGTQQYTVARWVQRVRRELLFAAGRWQGKDLHKTLNTELLKEMSVFIDQWLSRHYRHPSEPS